MRLQTLLPHIVDHYRELQSSHNVALFVERVQKQYTETTLLRIAFSGSTEIRRAVALALGFIGEEESNAVLGQLLHDSDRIVRLVAENSLKNLWPRLSAANERERLRNIMRMILLGDFSNAVSEANILIEHAPLYSEAYNQRAIALFGLKQYWHAIEDCDETLALNPFHFGAIVAKAHCFLELKDADSAIDTFEYALKVNPNLDIVRRNLLRVCGGI